MNQINQYIFNIYHFLVHTRDTMEYAVENPNAAPDKKIYDAHKQVITTGYKEGSAFGNWLRDNAEKAKDITPKLDELVNDIYGESSSIVHVTDAGEIRVDHTQNIRVLELVSNASEAIRDVIYGYLNYARQQKQQDEEMEKLIVEGERVYRGVFAMLAFREMQKSFAEFQKAVAEAKGQRTPQSNYIVQNEIGKLAAMIRASRAHCHAIDNETLDTLDLINENIEMMEGRRERRENKSFKDLFDNANHVVGEYVNKMQKLWFPDYKAKLDYMVEESKKAAEAAKA